MIGNIKAHPEWKLLIEAYNEYNYGTMIPHRDIEKLIGYTREKHPQKYYQIVNRWRKEMLREYSKQIECHITRGYEIIKPEDFRKSATRQLRLGGKHTKKAGEIVVKAPVDLLNEDEKKKIGQTGIVIAQILHFQKATLKKVREIDKKTDKLLIDVGKALDVGD